MDRKPVVPLPAGARIDEFVNGRANADLRVRRRSERRGRGSFSWPIASCAPTPSSRTSRCARRRFARRRAGSSSTTARGRHPAAVGLLAHRAPAPRPPARRGRSVDQGLRRVLRAAGVLDRRRRALPSSVVSAVWDTGLAALALEDAGVSSDHPALAAGRELAMDEQIESGGDWLASAAARRRAAGRSSSQTMSTPTPTTAPSCSSRSCRSTWTPSERARPSAAGRDGSSGCRAETAAGAPSIGTTPERGRATSRSPTSRDDRPAVRRRHRPHC